LALDDDVHRRKTIDELLARARSRLARVVPGV